MPKLNRQEVFAQLSAATKLSIDEIELLFVSLSKLAAEHVSDGFLIPELGELRLALGPDQTWRNPATGEMITTSGQPVVEFKPDTATSAELRSSIPASDDPPRAPTILPEIRLVPDDQDWIAARQSEQLYDSAIHKLGGQPSWVQSKDTPVCCAREMTFYGQFDSKVGGRFNVMDAAIILVFVCDECSKPHAVVQSH